jgi:long-chain fatty acid transport protein
MKKTTASAIICACAFAAASGGANAAGFQLSEASVAGMTRAFAGAGVVGDDMSAAFYNPAGMSLIKRRGAQLNMTYINIRSKFAGETTLPGVGTNANASATGDIESFIPAAFFVAPIDDRLTLGASLSLPFGLGTEYERNSDVAKFAVDSNLRMLELDVSAAYKITNRLTLGASIGAQEGKAALSSVHPNPALGGLLVELEADDMRAAFNVGAMYEFDGNNRVGLSFRPSVSHNLKGENKADGRDIEAAIETPELVILSGYNKLSDRFGLSSTIKWTRWSRFKELDIRYSDTGAPVSTVDESWNDTYMASLGLDYYMNPEWTLRTGLGYEQTPIPDDKRRTARIPDNVRIMLGLGASWSPNADVTLDFGYTAMLIRDAKINNDTSFGNMKGDYESVGLSGLLGLSAQVRF